MVYGEYLMNASCVSGAVVSPEAAVMTKNQSLSSRNYQSSGNDRQVNNKVQHSVVSVKGNHKRGT